MCQEAGILAKLVSHDFRRGGAKDIQNLPVNPKGFLTSDAVADSLGHSLNAKQAGITQQYAGHKEVDFFQLRRQQPAEEETPDPFGQGFAPEPMKKRRLESREVSRRIEAEELGAVNDISLRHRISKRIHQEEYQSQLYENSQMPAFTPWTASVMNVKVPQKRRRTERSVSPAAPVNKFTHPETDLEGGGGRLGDDEYAHRDGDDESMVIDPRLLDDTNDIASTLSGNLDMESMREATSAALVHIVVGTVASTTGSHPRDSAALLLLKSPQEFVSVFSRINLSVWDGGSRDKATLFKWKCKNASTGCTEPVPELLGPPPKASKEPPFTPSPCTGQFPECDITKIYQTRKELRAHTNKFHGSKARAFTVQMCSFPGCGRQEPFKTYKAYYGHLRDSHNVPLRRAEMAVYIQLPPPQTTLALKCPLSGPTHAKNGRKTCGSGDKIFRTYNGLRIHLCSAIHNKTTAEATQLTAAMGAAADITPTPQEQEQEDEEDLFTD
ncbi:MAG: hypothetical protein Q9210_005930 [Variospora velana]